jgi:hypothetical protein
MEEEKAAFRFEDLFHSDQRRALRHRTVFRWHFDGPDLNESAKALFQHLDSVMTILTSSGFSFLTTIELDAERGRFPAVLLQYFQEVDLDSSRTFFVAPIRHLRDGPYAVGRLTFEAEPGEVVQVLGHNGGFRWGAALRVWGIQVGTVRVPEVVDITPYDARHVDAIGEASRAAWVTTPDLNAISLWVAPTIEKEILDRLPNLDRLAQ